MTSQEAERCLSGIFRCGTKFKFNGQKEVVKVSGKPSPPSGECKTDLYIRCASWREIKISIKLPNADFLENKTSLERATQIFGPDAQNIIEVHTKSIEHKFEEETLIHFQPAGRANQGTIMFGWKFELLNKLGGKKSAKMDLTNEQKIDVYAGRNLTANKRNSAVGGQIIENSGVADYILEFDNQITDPDAHIARLQPIVTFAPKQDIYFACKALNYRIEADKWDGDRPLAVYIEWVLIENRLTPHFRYDKPLSIKGNIVGENVRSILKKLKIDQNNFPELEKYYQ